MKRKIIYFVAACMTSLVLMFTGCGSGGSDSSAPAVATVSGVAATGAPIVGQVFLKDSANSAEKTMMIGTDGSFTFNVDGMKPPFILRAEWTANGTVHYLYSFAGRPGTANINPFANAVVAGAASNVDPASIYANPDSSVLQMVATNLPASLADLQGKLKPLLDQYQASTDPLTGSYKADHTGLDALFDAVKIEVAGGSIMVTNVQTGATIFSCPTNDIGSGAFNAANMPAVSPTPTPTPGKAVYDTNCAGCHRLGTYDPTGSAPNLSGKGTLVDSKYTAGVSGHKGINLSATQITDIKAFLNTN